MFVFSNLATSIDGKIATTSRAYFPLGTDEDRRQMQVLRRKSDIVLFGASTLRTYKGFCGLKDAPASRQPANAIVSSSLEGISAAWPFFRDPGKRRILFVTQMPSAARLRTFQRSSEVVLLEKPTSKKPVALQIVRALEDLGFKKLLVEGGGGIMWGFASQDLIDEYNVTITPRVVGGVGAPTLVDGPGLPPKGVVNLKLARCKRIGDELYLIYRKTGKRG